MRTTILGMSLLLSCGGELSTGDGAPPAEGDEPGECTDGVDNDDDGSVDCADDGCVGSPDCADGTDPAGGAPPTAPEVAVTPADPLPGEALLCTVLRPGEDPEGEPVTHRFSWEVAGAGTALADPELPAGETGGEETWTCVVVADDGAQTGPEGRASVTTAAENSAPGAPVLAIVPAEPATNQPLRCDVVEPGIDPDGDTVSHAFRWLKNGVDSGIVGEQVERSATEPGDTWTCIAAASDGELDGPEAETAVDVTEARFSGDVTGLGGATYSASSCFLGCADGTYGPGNAFDDNPGTAGYSTWHATWGGGPEWIAVDFGAGNDKAVTRYGLMGASFHEGYRVRDFSLEGSHDGETWVTVDSVANASLAFVMYGGEPMSYFEHAHTDAYRHWRYLITDNEGGQPWANEVGIVEIEMFEDEPVE